ncbi:PilZ domain-containing protein [Erythrobacter sp. SCSIO 43205]|uniref:PilZ domain-containing protein n=1 Tax=Erythrobacter sp. SCSIO 43205 TaxID=2779361 RepID=UPI001CA81C0E|nr:PilZ domain-containing protein [Erythrobacter sp. SCSIO 43205]UAB78583.1 PilZ domain-containing protein [Erythrobacter sp. SCSIO 43205]
MEQSSSKSTKAQGANKRQSHRASLMLRRAKLVCQSGEYLTLIRDVSENGIGLGFLHDVPPETRTILQLANGMTYPVERMWAQSRQAGYRFGCTITLDEFLREETPHPIRPLRLNIEGTARIQDARKVIDAKLVDLSCEGAKIASFEDIRTRGLISFELPGMSPRLAQVRWSEGEFYGLQFQHPLESEELAHCAMQLQPFGDMKKSRFAKLLAKARAA